MTTYRLADAVTTTSLYPTIIVDRPGSLYPPTTSQLFQFEMNGPTTCTGTFQPMGSLDSAQTLPPQGAGGAWVNIGSPVTITCSTPGITPAVATVTSAQPFTRWGCAVTALSGGGAATARVEL